MVRRGSRVKRVSLAVGRISCQKAIAPGLEIFPAAIRFLLTLLGGRGGAASLLVEVNDGKFDIVRVLFGHRFCYRGYAASCILEWEGVPRA
jgi:hypothetical protein